MSTSVRKNATVNDEAVEFFRQVGEASLPATAVLYKFADLMTQYDPIEEADQLDAALTALISDFGYGTDYETLQEVFSYAMASELGCWSGTYMLFDEEGTTYPLVVGRDGAQVLTPLSTEAAGTMTPEQASEAVKRMTLEGSAFKDGVLILSNDRYAFSLRFPVSELDSNDVADDSSGIQPRCEGAVTIITDGKSKTLSVEGKRGSYTRAGVEQPADGDPAATWTGVYQLYETTDRTAIKWVTDRVTISMGEDGMEWSWGSDVSGDHYQYQGNVLLCSDADDDTIRYAMRFSLNADGVRQLALAKVISGQISAGAERTYVGLWAGDAAREPVTPAPNFKAAARQAMAADGSSGVITGAPATPDDPSYLTKFFIDLTQLSNTAGSPTPVQMPYGVYSSAGNAYVVTLALSHNTGKNYAWATAPATPPASSDATPRMHLRTVAADTTGATITLTFSGFAATDVTAGTLSGCVNVIDVSDSSNPLTYYMQLQIPVIQAPPIVISPTSIPAPVQDVSYAAAFAAAGGEAQEYVWFDNKSNLPAGLTFNLATQELKGTPKVSDSGSVAGATYTLSMLAYAPQGWVMNPADVNVSFTLLPFSQVLASDVSYATQIGTVVSLAVAAASMAGGYLSYFKALPAWRKNKDRAKIKKFTESLQQILKRMETSYGKANIIVTHFESALAKDQERMKEYGSFKSDNESLVKRMSMAVDMLLLTSERREVEIKYLMSIYSEWVDSGDPGSEFYESDKKSRYYGWSYKEIKSLIDMLNDAYFGDDGVDNIHIKELLKIYLPIYQGTQFSRANKEVDDKIRRAQDKQKDYFSAGSEEWFMDK